MIEASLFAPTDGSAAGESAPADAARAEAAIELAARWLTEARRQPGDRRRRRRLGRVVNDDRALTLSIGLADSVLRAPDRRRAAHLFAGLIDRVGVPSTLSAVDRLGLRIARRIAPISPALVMPFIERRVRGESAEVILAAETTPLARHLARRRMAGYHVNVNVLGEAVLGEAEAVGRLAAITRTLERPDVDYISVKVSAIATQLDPVAFDDSVDRIVSRLRPLFASAAASSPAKFINLDMEEYRDLELTLAAFMRLLDEPQLERLEAGIVLQAYLPDSHAAFERLAEWSRARCGRGGASIKIRLVKGANLAMEHVEAELHGWVAAPYDSKADVDASYKRLVDRALQPDTAGAVRIGLASHNLFDIAWALTLATERGALDRVEFEMLAGMAVTEADQLRRQVGSVRLYTPIVKRRDRTSAIAYLVRRLDENTTRGNFLREAFSIEAGSPQFIEQADLFRAAVLARHGVSTAHRRRATTASTSDRFINEPDTDLVLPDGRRRVLDAVDAARSAPPFEVPVVIGGVAHTGANPESWFDPSEPRRLTHRFHVVDRSLVDAAIAAAANGEMEWHTRGADGRAGVLRTAADLMAAERATTIGAMVVDCGKTIAEADPEVSEAIDFARYYAANAMDMAAAVTQADGRPRGVTLVVPPWNFPYAIAAGGVLASLAAGNAVLLKPAPEAVRIGWLLADQLWRAGVPADVLQFVPSRDDDVGRHLVTHPGIDTVILTGSLATAELFMSWKPQIHLLAETSGKNALVITAAADVDAAIRDLVHSAFGHAGQKCSAASLAIVEAAVYDDPAFLRQLADAVTSLRVGPSWRPTTSIGPVIRPPDGPLLRALTQLDDGESWLVAPRVDDVNPRLWSPGVKLGVQPGSWSHRTEWFGPVLAIMRAPDLETAITWQNATDFGLTAGLHSLDPDECTRFVERVEAGNVYVNRQITGAIVQRQPFGGWKRSAVGPGAKAGGPGYVASLQQWRTLPDPSAPNPSADAAESFADAWTTNFSQGHDPTGLRAERNVLRHLPLPDGVVVRIGDATTPDQIELARLAASTTGTAVSFSSDTPRAIVDLVVESTNELGRRIVGRPPSRLRLLADVGDDALRRAAWRAGVTVDTTDLVADGRVELARWLREQSISITAHRYGSFNGAPMPRL